MLSKTITVKNRHGLHMRPAGDFVKAMSKYEGTSVTVIKGNHQIDGKSIMNLITACIKCGTEITIEFDGPDEKAAMKEAVELIESRFGE
ncbi:MAG: HPr family phosphocarrier protein [Ruminococcus sp.]|nr:HPr family phosphocarrier protein [Ruminococcus sp.]